MLTAQLTSRLDEMAAQAAALQERLVDPAVASDHVEYRRVNRELSSLRRTVDLYGRYKQALAEIEEAKEILADGAS